MNTAQASQVLCKDRSADMANRLSEAQPAQQAITLESLPTMTKEELRAAWTRITGKPPLNTQSHEFLLMAVAWELQAKQFGGLKPAVRRKLESLAVALEGGAAIPRHDRRPRYRPGTVVTKQWHGTNHTITVLEDSYAYQSTVYKSLSEIARVITGTRWNGPRFFGLRSAKDRTRSDG